jgi:DNA-binding transcriptional MocR family regulator
LETAVALAHEADGDLVVDASVRSLASEVGLSKNTVARALGMLREAGLVTFTQTRADDGAFSAGRYAIVLPAGAFTFAAPTKTSRSPPRRPTGSRVPRSSSSRGSRTNPDCSVVGCVGVRSRLSRVVMGDRLSGW